MSTFDDDAYLNLNRQLQELMGQFQGSRPPPGASTEAVWAYKSRIATTLYPLLDKMWEMLIADGSVEPESQLYLDTKRNYDELKELLSRYMAH
jgi:hypothetical protein